MNTTPSGERLRIGLFGRRNVGKSSLINALADQQTALVSPVPGTTTDPVRKAMEILPLGPLLLIDTAGLDDEGELGRQRVDRSRAELGICDLVLLVLAPQENAHDDQNCELEASLVQELEQKRIPWLLVLNKSDQGQAADWHPALPPSLGQAPLVRVSARLGTGLAELKQLIIRSMDDQEAVRSIAGDLFSPGETVLLVVPIDNAAPRGRLILPQVQTIRDILDHDGVALVVKERELAHALDRLRRVPRLVITDSQVFQKVAADTPPQVGLTSFSILFARYRGDLAAYIDGIRALEHLQDGSRILIAEACTHHVQADDIGTVKIPRWLRERTGLNLEFHKVSGRDFPPDLSSYNVVIQCGGCMLGRREILARIAAAGAAGVPITNYGMVIAWCFGILERALAPFPHAVDLLQGRKL